MITNSVLLQAPANDWSGIIMIVALVAIFYFFMIRPQQKRQKEIKKFRDGLKTGDNIITAGGIHGKIRNVNDTTFQIEIAEGVKILIDKGSVYPSAADAAQAAGETKN
ncbi:MAG: preprotein translocase subunit YajC [Bacteroidales bacterium]|nr:preprotein translocase subunit YajC [Bacteroidales bacterium]